MYTLFGGSQREGVGCHSVWGREQKNYREGTHGIKGSTATRMRESKRTTGVWMSDRAHPACLHPREQGDPMAAERCITHSNYVFNNYLRHILYRVRRARERQEGCFTNSSPSLETLRETPVPPAAKPPSLALVCAIDPSSTSYHFRKIPGPHKIYIKW